MRPIEKRLDRLSSELCRLMYNGLCYNCWLIGHEPHHIISRNHKRQRWNMENLVYLCRGCHNTAHNENWTFNRVLDRSVKHWSLPELKELEAELKLKINNMKIF